MRRPPMLAVPRSLTLLVMVQEEVSENHGRFFLDGSPTKKYPRKIHACREQGIVMLFGHCPVTLLLCRC